MSMPYWAWFECQYLWALLVQHQSRVLGSPAILGWRGVYECHNQYVECLWLKTRFCEGRHCPTLNYMLLPLWSDHSIMEVTGSFMWSTVEVQGKVEKPASWVHGRKSFWFLCQYSRVSVSTCLSGWLWLTGVGTTLTTVSFRRSLLALCNSWAALSSHSYWTKTWLDWDVGQIVIVTFIVIITIVWCSWKLLSA